MKLITIIGSIVILFSLTFISCQDTDSSEITDKNPLEFRIDSLTEAYESKPDKYLAAELIASYINKVEEYSYDEEKAEDFEKMGDYAKYIGDAPMAISSYIWAMKADPESNQVEDIIYKVSEIYASDSMYQNNAQFLYNAYMIKYPQGKHLKEVKEKFNGQLSIEAYIDSLAQLVTKSDVEVRQESIRSYVDAVELYGSAMHEAKASPRYIQKAAMLLQVLNLDAKALSFYDWILMKFPESDEAENALFSKAIYHADANKDTTLVRSLYNEYLELYPEGKYAEDVKVLEKRVGKSIFPTEGE